MDRFWTFRSAAVGPSRGLKSQLRYAATCKASYAVIIGDDELAKGKYTIRNLNDSTQEELGRDQIIEIVTQVK